VKVQGKLDMRIIFEFVLMPLTENYQNWSMLVEATACQSWRVFLRHSVELRQNTDVKIIKCSLNVSAT